jgi:hypothetical protein
MLDLTSLANTFNSDKGTVHREAHAYTILYDLLFMLNRMGPLRLAEFGLQTGGPELMICADRKTTDIPSVRIWLEYFKNAEIFGFDISDFSGFVTDSFHFKRVDCGDSEQLLAAAAKAPQFDIIIDDASHASFHQQLTFVTFFPKLRPGGIYIIEDLHWQPAKLEAELPPAALSRHVFANPYARFQEPVSEAVVAFRQDILDVQLYSAATLQTLRKEYNERHNLPPHGDDIPAAMSSRLRRIIRPKSLPKHGERAPVNEAKLLVLQKHP